MREKVEILVSRNIVEKQVGCAVLQAAREIGHAEQAAWDGAGLAVDPGSGPGLENIRETGLHPGRYCGVLPSSADRQLAVHSLMLGVYAEHVRSEFLPFLGQQAGLFGFLYGFVRPCAAAAYLVTGSVPAVMAHVERLVAFGRGRVCSRDIFIRVIDTCESVDVFTDRGFEILCTDVQCEEAQGGKQGEDGFSHRSVSL